ncbi:YtcA family lipoprotein [Ancylobacter mangrovi]|uniref:YtcA family lipoprotein n=1 Tax=Ancylobacter mangrovi TaxID=2972472 RepID=UPI00216297B5|nr:YtcA family lipoprotein [Ancylobacter mangrovi]MCS0501939.1 YtcA family lipoprotein [Ancylobacter mangrovi]
MSGLLAPALVGLGGCSPYASPSVPLFGAYFPFWLFCAAAGVIGALVLRAVFIRLGIDDVLPWRLIVYTCLAAAIGFSLALLVYGR